jgi:hypothetical protein
VVEEIDGRHFKNGDDFREFVKREFADLNPSKERLYMALVRRKEGVRYAVIKKTAATAKVGAKVKAGQDGSGQQQQPAEE